MRRILFLLLVLSLVVGACSDGESASTTGAVAATTLPTDPVTTVPAGEDDEPATTTTPRATTTLSDRPLAPDFTLELGEGGSYTLSEGAKPVYLVFWAEW